jgi:hypothetical protein
VINATALRKAPAEVRCGVANVPELRKKRAVVGVGTTR